MGNSNSAKQIRAASRHDTVQRDRSSNSGGRGKGRAAGTTTASTFTHARRTRHSSHRTASASPSTPFFALPGHTVVASCRPSPLLPPSATCDGAASQRNPSGLSDGALLRRVESATSKDSLAEGMRAAEELSAATLDTCSSCPLVGPRNITTQFEQTSEKPKLSSCIFEFEILQSDTALDKQSSTTAELMRQESFEGRMSHSIAIVEDWLASQEKINPPVA